jgi:tetratricopeptide (TPR) repeat protein
VATCAAELFPDGAAWLDGGRLVSELGRLGRRLGWAEQREPTPEEALALLERALHGKKFLIVVDNFDPVSGRSEQVPRLMGDCRTLVTSRSRTLGVWLEAKSFALGVWTPEACREYLRERCEHLRFVPDVELDALTHFVGHLPLALRLLVFLLEHRPGTSAGMLLGILKAKPLGVLDQYAGDGGIAATFQVSYDALTNAGKRILTALAVCATQTRADIVGAVAGVEDVLAGLDDLYTRGLAELSRETEAPWGMHDVVRMFVLEQPGREALEAAHAAWVRRHIEDHADPTAHRQFARGVDEACVVFERLVAQDAEQAGSVYVPLVDHLRLVGRYGDAIALSTSMHTLAPSASTLAATAMNRLGRCHLTLGDIQQAISSHDRALFLFEALGDLKPQASELGNLGLCYLTLGDIQKAIDLLERALCIDTTLGRLKGQANSLANLGLCHYTLGDTRKAIELLERALALNEVLGRLKGQALNLGNLGLVYFQMEDIPKAIEFHSRALSIDAALGRLEGQAMDLGNLGRCYLAMGDIPGAIDFHQRALVINQNLGRIKGQAIQLGNLGTCHQTSGNIPKAREHYVRSIDLYRRMGLPEEHPELRRYTELLRELP